MVVAIVENRETIASLYVGWEETMIYSYLQGRMGKAYVTSKSKPRSAVIKIADFCFFAGLVDADLIRYVSQEAVVLVPRNDAWAKAIEEVCPKATKRSRYALKKEPHVFDQTYLQGIVKKLDTIYEIQLINEKTYQQIMGQSWSKDLCYNFDDYLDFSKRGLGVVILHQGEVIAGASSYTVYHEGIEIEIDTKKEYRRNGLGLVCGAKIILECLQRDLYPSWDAHNLGSLSLAKKLGYHFDQEYVVYEV